MIKKIIILTFVVSAFFSCSKDDDEELAVEPTIGLISIAPLEVTEYDTSVAITISYKDNNGDIGYSDPDVYALQVKDSRLDSADWYHIPPLAPVGNDIVIEGQLTIRLNSMFILGNGNEEVASLTIKLRDRNSNWSNIINTPNITIRK